jgi:sugar lactone lactonase YvrE
VWGPDGRPYFAAGDSIWTIDAGGILRLVAGNGDELHPGDADGPALSALFSSDIASLAFDAGGDLFIADHGNLKIKELAGGIVTTVAGAANGAQGDGPALQVQVLPFGLTVQADGTVVFTEWNRPGLVRTLHNGMVTTIAGGPVGTNGAFYGPDGVPSTQTHLDFPLGISSGPDGSVYFADNANNRVRRIAPDSIVSTVAGDGGGTYRGDGNLAVLASFPSPDGVSVDGAGNLFVSETNDIEFDNYISYPTDYVIRQVSRHGMVTLIAGTGQQGQGPSGPSLSSPLLDPLGISAGAGGLLVADRTTLRLITPPSTGWPDPAVSVTCDPFDIGVVGDAYASTASVNGQANRPWLDVVQGNVTSDGSTLTATITVDNLLAIGQGPPVNTLGQANAWMYYFETDDWKYHYLLALAPLSTQDPYSPGQVSFEYGTAVQETEDLYFIDRQGIATGSFDTSANTVTLNKDLRSLGVQPGQQIIEQHYDGGELLEGAPVQTRSVEADDLDGTSRSYTVGKNCPEAFVNGPGTATPEATTCLLPIAGGLGGAVAVMRRRHRRGDREKATEAEA